jgi:hypothetical protein
MPDTMQPAPLPSVYQLRVVVRGVSPLIWRRLLIAADTTIAGLHAVLQIAFGWTGTHLHRFVVQGRQYAAIRAAEILGMLLETEDLTRFGEHRDELAGLLPLLGVDRFDRRTLNRALAALSATGTRAA